MKRPLDGLRGALLDIDGTLLRHDLPIPGAAGLLALLRERDVRFRLFTNTTRRSRAATAAVLRRAGLAVDAAEILTPAVLARRRVLDSGQTRCGLLVPAEAQADLADLQLDEVAPDWVVVADLGPGFTFERLNSAFRWIRSGARLLALHKNPCWQPSAEEGWVLDAGAFVAALEFAAGVEAEVVGKPSPAFFRLALADLGVPPEATLVVGDDPATDVAGGAAAGCRTALVRTGVFAGGTERLSPAPDMVIESVAELWVG